MYYFVERSVAVIKPKQLFLDWINQTFTELPHELTLESIRIDCNSYLIPEVAELEDGINFIDNKFFDLFELELASWNEDKDTWPKNLTLKMFWEWFDVEIHQTTIDLVGDNENTDFEDKDTLH